MSASDHGENRFTKADVMTYMNLQLQSKSQSTLHKNEPAEMFLVTEKMRI